jgi:CIC family chloride channel protein
MPGKSDSLRLAIAILLAGVLVGVVGALFIGALGWVDDARLALQDAALSRSFPGWLAGVMAGLVGAAVAAWLAHRYASDSPQVAAVESPGISQRRTSILGAFTVNFAGTGLAVGAGLALGPERPAIQMGGAVGHLVSRLTGLRRPDHELMMAATGSAGVATMFNSPLGCAAYAVETVIRRVDLRISLTVLGIGAIAVGVSRLFTGQVVNFSVGQLTAYQSWHLWLYFLLGCLIAVIANLQARTIMLIVGLCQLPRLPSAVRGGLIGAAVGLLAWYSPGLVGSGDALIQGVIDGRFVLSTLTLMLLVRFFLGPLSLAAGTPGGYFTPVLLLGALCGVIFGDLVGTWLPAADMPPTAHFALVGIAVALATIARAPFTGILLAMETTGAFVMALPMIVAVFGAVAVIQVLHTPSLSHGLEALGERLREFRERPEE